MDALLIPFSPPPDSASYLSHSQSRFKQQQQQAAAAARDPPSPPKASGSRHLQAQYSVPYPSPPDSGMQSSPWEAAGGMASSSMEGTGSRGEVEGKGKGKEVQKGYLRVRIIGLERNRKDLLVRFDASTNLTNFRTGVYRNMQRSYVEFQKFAEQAQLTSPQTIIPALPLASTSATTDEEDDRLVRIALQRWLTRICEDPALLADEELRSFIESDFGYSPTPPPTARRSTSAPLAFTAAISKVVRRGPLDEDDELASARGALDKLETTWGGAAGAINNLGKVRRAHALANQEVGAKLINLSTVESDFHLSAAERKMGRALEALAGLAGAQTASENVILSDSLGYQALNARAAKDALAQRTQLLEDSQTSSKSSITKRRNVERLKGSSSINPSKVDDAIAEMEDAESLESTLQRQLAAISTNLHLSLRQHSRNAHEDVALALLENARLSVGFHKAALRELEAVRADLRRVGGEGEGYGVTNGEGGRAGYASTPPPPQPRQSPTAAPVRNGVSASTSQPHMTSSRPYDSHLSQAPRASQPPPTSQSMFLPPPPSASSSSTFRPPPPFPNQHQQPSSQPQQPQASHDPLGGHMTQSMVLPPGHRPGSGAGGTAGQNGGTQAKRLDSRQAAKLLAGGF